MQCRDGKPVPTGSGEATWRSSRSSPQRAAHPVAAVIPPSLWFGPLVWLPSLAFPVLLLCHLLRDAAAEAVKA